MTDLALRPTARIASSMKPADTIRNRMPEISLRKKISVEFPI